MFLYEKNMLSLLLYVATTPKQLMNCLVGTTLGFGLPCFPCDLEKTFWHQVHLVSCMFQIVLESSSIDYYFYVLFNYLKTQRIVFVFHFSLHWLLLWSILKIFRSKRLWLDGFQKLSSVLTLKELSDLQEVMRDKELNIRTDIYEILLQDETDTWLNVSLVCIKNSRTASHDIVGNHYLSRFQQIGFTLQCTRWMQCTMISMPLDWLPCQIWPCFSISSFNMDLVACHSGYLIWHILIGSTEGSSLGPRQDESRTVVQFLWRNNGTASISLALWKTCKTKTAKAADPYVNYL